MKRLLAAILILFSLSACQNLSVEEADLDPKAINYIKDTRTNLCFGVVSSISPTGYGGSISITQVPCEKVKHLIKQ